MAAPMTPALADQLVDINTTVNQTIEYKLDGGAYGPDEANLVLEPGTGDCEDYALTKRYLANKKYRIPLGCLSVAFADVAYLQDAIHAVLVAHTSAGDYVLDNFIPEVMPWTVCPYLLVFLAEAPPGWRATEAVQRIFDTQKTYGNEKAKELGEQLTLAQFASGRHYHDRYLKPLGLDATGRILR